MVKKSSPSGVTVTLEWRDSTRIKVLAKMQSGPLDVGLEKGRQTQSSGLLRTEDLAYVIS